MHCARLLAASTPWRHSTTAVLPHDSLSIPRVTPVCRAAGPIGLSADGGRSGHFLSPQRATDELRRVLPCGIINCVEHDLTTAMKFVADQPERFLTCWYGPPQRPLGKADDSPGAAAELARFHHQISRWDAAVLTQNSVPAEGQRDEELLLVGVENQGVWLWGVDDGDENPWVLERENAPGRHWTPTGERLDEYLWHFVLFEAVLGARHALAINNATQDELHRFLRGWSRLPVKPWQWPGPDHSLWFRERSLAFTCANERPGMSVESNTFFAVFVASRDEASLARLPSVDLEWDYDSRSSG